MYIQVPVVGFVFLCIFGFIGGGMVLLAIIAIVQALIETGRESKYKKEKIMASKCPEEIER